MLGALLKLNEKINERCTCVIHEFLPIIKSAEKGKSVERRRRKITGLRGTRSYDSGVART